MRHRSWWISVGFHSLLLWDRTRLLRPLSWEGSLYAFGFYFVGHLFCGSHYITCDMYLRLQGWLTDTWIWTSECVTFFVFEHVSSKMILLSLYRREDRNNMNFQLFNRDHFRELDYQNFITGEPSLCYYRFQNWCRRKHFNWSHCKW